MAKLKENVVSGSKLARKLKVDNDIPPLFILEGNLLTYVKDGDHYKRVMANGIKTNDGIIIDVLKETLSYMFSRTFEDLSVSKDYMGSFAIVENDIKLSFDKGDIVISTVGVKKNSRELVKRALSELMPTTFVTFEEKEVDEAYVSKKSSKVICELMEGFNLRRDAARALCALMCTTFALIVTVLSIPFMGNPFEVWPVFFISWIAAAPILHNLKNTLGFFEKPMEGEDERKDV